MNPISIFPPPTRALSRQNTKSNSNNNNNNSSTSPLSRFHTHSTDDPSSTSSSNNTTTQSTAGGLLHGRNKSFGTANGLGSSWAPFTSSSSAAADSPAHSSTTASSPQPQPTTSSAASTARKLIKKRTPSSAHTTTTSSSAGAASSLSNSTASLSPLGGSATAGSPAAFMTENILRNNNNSSQFTLSPGSATATKRKPTPDIPANLPQTIFFDRLRPTEVTAAHRLERQGYPEEDAASLEKLRYRQAAAPHLFMGAFLPGASKAGGKDTSNSSNANSSGGNAGNSAGNAGGGGGGGTGAGAGPNSTNSYPPRTLIGFITATAALALTLKSMSTHSNSRDARLVCIHSVVVMPEYQRHGLALRMLREYIGRLMRAELGPRGARLAAMAEAKANAEAASAAAATTAAAGTNLAPPPPPADGPTAPVAFADDDLLGEEDDEAELENERSGDRQSRKRGYEAIALLAHEEIMPLYLRAGFRVQGLSHVKYGSGDWYEMRREIVPRNAMRRDESEDSDEDDEDDQGPPTVVEPAKLSREASGGSTDVTPKASNTLDMPLLSSPGQHSQGASGGSSDKGGGGSGGGGGVTASPPTLNLPKSIDASALLAALTGSSSKANPAENKARTPSSTGISSPPQAPRNPGTPFSTVLGQALAGKTASEDPRSTLEARLVNREEDTNLADLYCPREACNCLLLRADLGVWKARELGPLSAPALQSSGGVLPANSPAPPLNGVVAPLPMRPSVDNHSSPLLFATTGVHQQQQQQQPKITMQGATSLRDFWSVPSPFVFDNISFSKDVQWPPPKMMGPSSTSSATPTSTTATKGRMPLINRGRSNSGSLLSSPPSGPVAGAGAGAGKEVQESISSPTSPGGGGGGLRERSQSASASMVLNASAEGKSSGVEEGEGGEGDVNVDSHNRTPGEEKQRALFAQGVEAGAPTLAATPLASGGVSSESTSAGVGVGAASASTPQLVSSVPPGSTKAHGSRIGGLKLTIGKRKTSLAIPTLGNSGDSSGSTTGNLEGGGALLSPAAITPSVVSPGTPSWAASVATSGKKGLAAALGRGGKKDKDKEREREKDGVQQQHWSPMVGGSTHGTSSPSTGTSSPGAGGGGGPAHLSPGGAGDLWIGGGGGGGGGSAAPIQRLSAYGIDPHAYPFNTSSAYTSGSWHMPGSSHPDPSVSASSPAVESGPKLTIKYLLCPECDCGPLGYVVISEEMKGGGLARAVAASQGGRDEGGSGDVGGGAGAGKRKMEYLLAADRVRYRFRASN